MSNEDLLAALVEVKDSIEILSSKLANLSTEISKAQLRILTAEHKAGTAIDLEHEAFVRLTKVEERLTALEAAE